MEGLFHLDEMAARAGWRSNRSAGTYRHTDGRVVDCIASPIQTSTIPGLFRVTAHMWSSADPWHVPGQIGNRFEYHPLPTPIPCRGAQGFWTVPEDVAAQIEVPRG